MQQQDPTAMMKKCFVPSCDNTSMNSNKRFITIPRCMEIREKWYSAVGKPLVAKSKAYYCCEDHFDMENDCANWVGYKLYKMRKLQMKKDVVPHKHLETASDVPKEFSQLPQKAEVVPAGDFDSVGNLISIKTEAMDEDDDIEDADFWADGIIKEGEEEDTEPDEEENEEAKGTEVARKEQRKDEKKEKEENNKKQKQEEPTTTQIKSESLDIEMKTETYLCEKCGATLSTEKDFCDDCQTEQRLVADIVREDFEQFLKATGLPNMQSFIELLGYIEDDLPELESCTKDNQLFGVIMKLRQNDEAGYINKYRFPLVFVTVVSTLHDKLSILSGRQLITERIPPFLKSSFPYSVRIVALEILKIKLDSKDKYINMLIGYNANGKVFYISKPYHRTCAFRTAVLNDGVLKTFPSHGTWLVFKKGGEHPVKVKVREFSAPQYATQRYCTKLGKTARKHFEMVFGRLRGQFQILEERFPEYFLLETDEVNFVEKLVRACCGLLNYRLSL